MKEDLIPGNKLIAEFMGYKFFKSAFGGYGLCTDENDMSTWIELNDCRYHSSWDWLMPVVSKIETLGAIGDTSEMKGAYKLYIDPWYMDFSDYSEEETARLVVVNRNEYNNFLQPIYDLVLGFIKWYNAQNTPLCAPPSH